MNLPICDDHKDVILKIALFNYINCSIDYWSKRRWPYVYQETEFIIINTSFSFYEDGTQSIEQYISG